MMRVRVLVASLAVGSVATYDMGPTYGKDYSGMDYNVTVWNSGPDRAANNYEESAMECEGYCLIDPKCCAWTYCPPNSGDVGANDERCCLKESVPPTEASTGHWTGLPPRATDPTHTTVTATCVAKSPPSPYPGLNFTHPRIHQSPDCLHKEGWHDMAGALTYKGSHHAFQGCPASGGWSHSTSEDLVHWTNQGRGVHEIQESYEGMSSLVTPCSGFVTVDDNGVPCAGFRQCGSSQGTTGLNPAAHTWDVPMELRCAQNENLTQWSDPIWMYPVYYYRALPYDPVRPWKDYDGKWYSSWSTDGCNSTTKKVPCAAGGQLELLTSPVLRGAGTNWVQLDAMFTTNMTKSGAATAPGAITREFVTSGYFGGIPGDPDGGTTRVVTQNNAGPTFWVGKQANGSEFIPFWDKIGAVGHYDYGSLTMARTLGSDPNQVAVNGRRVLIGWIGGGSPASQSLARDLTLSAEYELLQQFVPELQMLRIPGSFSTVAVPTPAKAEAAAVATKGSLQLEVFASFTWTGPNPTKPFGVTVLGGAANLTVDCTADVASAPKAQGGCQVGVMKSSGPLMPIGTKTVTVHAFVDHSIVETIFNNRTAMVTYAVLQDETATSVALFGLDGLDGTVVTGQLTTWQLKEANNFGPQP
eukprot:m.17890 g.17890  ORF g.17890 m.17890 type:complete len:641 (+) comp9448_c1_seq1:4801-6723(+)